ncbi:hypothetical protein RSOLAG1IB_08068 [Rhizoctonia solani AG-1 IB]|uniref:PPR domain-containing protein n=2 Tax=Thanatephorus cucumeris (strain AG1-IB / isolate 7/3/14) TaxID=1108050 RepID=A0A0B7FFF9_THACB|nr:hypothetical protein RSOLAG1IB_08068 [Rhizoctonia solani AG-1 IB]
MPVRVGRRIRQLISPSLCTRYLVLVGTRPPRLQCPVSTKATAVSANPPVPEFRRKPKREQAARPPLSPTDQTIRQRITSLFSVPTNPETERELVELRNTPLLSPKLVCLLAEALAHHAYIPDTLEIINQSRKNGMEIPPKLYESIVFRLAQRGRWAEILNLLEPLQSLSPSGPKETEHAITTRLCEWRVRACAELGDFAGMERALGMFPHGIPFRTWKIAERACLKNSDFRMAERIQDVLRLERRYRDKGKETVGKGDGEELRVDEIVQILIHHFQPLDATLHDTPTTIITRTLQTNSRSPPTYLITKHPTPSTSSHPPDLSYSFTPNSRLATRCVRELIQKDRVAEAATMVAAMCKKTAPIDDVSPLQRHSHTSTHETSTLSLFEIFSSVRPSIHVFNTLLKGVLNTRGLRGMLALLEIMHDTEVKPDSQTAALLLRYLDRQRAWSPGRIIDTLVDLTSPIPSNYSNDPAVPPKPQPVPVSIQHTNVLLSSILNAERDATLGGGWKASSAFLRYHNRPIDRWPSSDARLASSNDIDPPTAGLRLKARADSLKPILEALRSRGVRNDSMAYALRTQRDGVVRLDPEGGRQVLQRADIPLGDYHYAALMAGLAECGYMDSAKAVMKSAHESGFGVGSPVMHTILISGYGRMGLARQAERVFKQMILAKVKPDAIAVDALAGAWFISGEYQRARQIVLRYWPGDGELPFREDTPLKKMIVELRKLRPISKVRSKRTQVSMEEDAYVTSIVQAIKAPDKTLPLASNIAAGEKKDNSGSSPRCYSSMATVGLQLDTTGWMKPKTSVGVRPGSTEFDGHGEQKPIARVHMMLSSSQNG